MPRQIKAVALLALIVTMFVLVAPVGTVQAEPLKKWCRDVGGQSQGTYCTISSDDSDGANVETSLDVPPGLTLVNGNNVNDSTINNEGTIGTSGTIINYGVINNYDTINNNGTINNTGTINNYDTINNNGTINNDGAIINCDGGSIIGSEINGTEPDDC